MSPVEFAVPSPPKRKSSLSDVIDADHPLSRSVSRQPSPGMNLSKLNKSPNSVISPGGLFLAMQPASGSPASAVPSPFDESMSFFVPPSLDVASPQVLARQVKPMANAQSSFPSPAFPSPMGNGLGGLGPHTSLPPPSPVVLNSLRISKEGGWAPEADATEQPRSILRRSSSATIWTTPQEEPASSLPEDLSLPGAVLPLDSPSDGAGTDTESGSDIEEDSQLEVHAEALLAEAEAELELEHMGAERQVRRRFRNPTPPDSPPSMELSWPYGQLEHMAAPAMPPTSLGGYAAPVMPRGPTSVQQPLPNHVQPLPNHVQPHMVQWVQYPGMPGPMPVMVVTQEQLDEQKLEQQKAAPEPKESKSRRRNKSPSRPKDGAKEEKQLPWGQLASFAVDPKGSRLLQAEVQKLAPPQLKRLCDELAPHMYSLSRHNFGNYLMQKCVGIKEMQEALAAAFRGHVVELLCHAQGSRVLQAYLAAVPTTTALSLVKELAGHVRQCALDTHGSWGVCLAFQHTAASFILDEVSANVCTLSVQQHGCRVVQSVLQAAAEAGMEVRCAVAALIEGRQLRELAMHPFGNYAVQVALRNCCPAQKHEMLHTLLKQVLSLAASKHGSNVAEVLLSLASPAELQKIAERIFANPAISDADALQKLISHPFGNYVLQALLRRLLEGGCAQAFQRLQTAASATSLGRSIINRMTKKEGAATPSA